MNVVIKNQFKAEQFAALFQHIRVFTEHVNIMFEKERMYLQTMDSSRISIIELTLPSTWFDEYEHTNPSAISLGVSSTMLFKILNTREKGQETQLLFDTENEDKLFINFTCEDTTVFNKKFEMPLMDIEYELMSIPDTTSQAEFSIPSSTFATLIGQLKIFGDTLEITCSEENIILHSISQESGKMLVEIGIDDLTTYSINEGETIQLSFSLNALHNICLYHKLVKDMEIHLTGNFPMKVLFNLGEENAEMSIYLAPKIND